jgi:radical SAM superfamily enzyme YgiQ (UPF0313 family)
MGGPETLESRWHELSTAPLHALTRGPFGSSEPHAAASSPSIDRDTADAFGNPRWGNAGFKILIYRLSPFRDVVRSSPHSFLFDECRRALPGAYIDLGFFPSFSDREILDRNGIGLGFGVGSLKPIVDFDLVLISNAYTLEVINLPFLFSRSGLPLFSSERDGGFPLVVLGGSNARASQSLFKPGGDSFVDAVFSGEGEGLVGALVGFLAGSRTEASGAAAKAVSAASGSVPAAEVPGKKALLIEASRLLTGITGNGTGPLLVTGAAVNDPPVGAAICHDAELLAPIAKAPVLPSEEASTARLAISWGCPGFCSFCFEGNERRPYRELPAKTVLSAAEAQRREKGASTVELYSFNFNTHSGVFELLLELNRRFERVNAMSQRVDILARTPLLLEAEIAADKRSFTLGIEGISSRMRAYYAKSLPDEDVRLVLRRLLDRKMREIKLFYILSGLETAEDMAEFALFTKELKDLKASAGSGVRILFSFGYLVRMPFTPLQFERLVLDEREWKKIVGPVKSAVETGGFEFRLATFFDEYCLTQVLALGGDMAGILAEGAAKGFCYDRILSKGAWNWFRERAEELGLIGPGFTEAKGRDHPFPFYRFESGSVEKAAFLHERFLEVGSGHDPGYCFDRCADCGACTEAAERQALLHHEIPVPPRAAYLRELEGLMQKKRNASVIRVVVDLPASAALRLEYAESFLLKSLLAASPALDPVLLSARLSFADRKGETVPAFGHTEVSLSVTDREKALDALASSPPPFLVRIEENEEGSLDSFDVELSLPSGWTERAIEALSQYCRNEHVGITLGRKGGVRLAVAAKDLKRKILEGADIGGGDAGEGQRMTLSCGRNFDLRAFYGLLGPGTAYLAPPRVTRLSVV